MADLYYHAREATEIFNTFGSGKPKTVDLGIEPISQGIGGFFAGNTVVIGAAQNVGKTSFVQYMLTNSAHKGGVASGEDGPDVWGARVIASLTGIKPQQLRRKDLTKAEKERVAAGLDELRARSEENLLPHVETCIGASPERLREVAHKLADQGCRYAVLDYLQKFKGHHSERRIEVSNTLSNWHAACDAVGMVPVAISQVVRMPATVEPNYWNLKESGDIENEARVIILLWRDSLGAADQHNLMLRGKVAKSSFGGGGLRFAYRFNDREQLEPCVEEEEEF